MAICGDQVTVDSVDALLALNPLIGFIPKSRFPLCMKTKINTLLGAALSLLVTLGGAENAAAQSERILFQGPVTETSRKKGELTETTTIQIFSMNVDGSDVRQITSGDEHSYRPRWSPDRNHIVFHQGDGSYSDPIYIMNSDGGDMFKVVDEYRYKGADWSPDGQYICYVGKDSTPPGPNALFVVEVDPYAKGKKNKVGTPVKIHEDGGFRWPAWSHGGNRIAYHNFNRIAVFDLTTGIETSLEGMTGFQPSWSHDDEQIAFIGYETGTTASYQLFIMNSDFSGITQVTDFDEQVWWPSWSENGQEIAFRVGGSEGWDSRSIYKLTLATGELTLLQNRADHPDWNP